MVANAPKDGIIQHAESSESQKQLAAVRGSSSRTEVNKNDIAKTPRGKRRIVRSPIKEQQAIDKEFRKLEERRMILRG